MLKIEQKNNFYFPKESACIFSDIWYIIGVGDYGRCCNQSFIKRNKYSDETKIAAARWLEKRPEFENPL